MNLAHRALAPFVFAVLAPTLALAQQPDDGAYGRMSGDSAVQVDVGVSVHRTKSTALTSLAVRYLHTAGLYATALDFIPSGSNDPRWLLSYGVEIRPMFLPRFLKNFEHGPARWDLTLDSLSLRVGSVSGKDYPFRSPGFEVGIGIGVPLVRNVEGPWLSAMGAMQWSHADLARDPGPASVLALMIGWQSTFNTNLVHLRDRPAR